MADRYGVPGQRRLNQYKAAVPLESHKEFSWEMLKEYEIVEFR